MDMKQIAELRGRAKTSLPAGAGLVATQSVLHEPVLHDEDPFFSLESTVCSSAGLVQRPSRPRKRRARSSGPRSR
jgi:hypothetical protein